MSVIWIIKKLVTPFSMIVFLYFSLNIEGVKVERRIQSM